MLADTGPGPVNFIDASGKPDSLRSVDSDRLGCNGESLNDGVYAVPGFLLAPAGGRARFVGYRPGAMANRSPCLAGGRLRSLFAGEFSNRRHRAGTLTTRSFGRVQILMEQGGKSPLVRLINRPPEARYNDRIKGTVQGLAGNGLGGSSESDQTRTGG